MTFVLKWSPHNLKVTLLFKQIFLIVRSFFRDRAWVGEGQRERGRHRIGSRLQALSCQHRARHGARAHKPWDHDLSWSWMLNQLSYPDTPLLKCFNVFERERERERERRRVSGGGAERGRPRIRSRLQALSCQHTAWHGAWTHKPWDHDLSRSWMLNQLSYPGAPPGICFNHYLSNPRAEETKASLKSHVLFSG